MTADRRRAGVMLRRAADEFSSSLPRELSNCTWVHDGRYSESTLLCVRRPERWQLGRDWPLFICHGAPELIRLYTWIFMRWSDSK